MEVSSLFASGQFEAAEKLCDVGKLLSVIAGSTYVYVLLERII
jgi:hypothetical protein